MAEHNDWKVLQNRVLARPHTLFPHPQVAFVLDELSRPRAVALLVSRALLLLLYAVRLR